MSAFAVLYNRSGMPVQAGMLERMMDRLTHRGPDGKDQIIQNHLAFGHWHFWTTPEETGEIQPLTGANTSFFLVLDGRLDNRTDLLSQLNLHAGSEGGSVSDAALILKSYEKWGSSFVEHLIGDYAFVLWDGTREQLFCVRDPLGERTLFYAWVGNTLAVASEAWAVAGAFDATPGLSGLGTSHFFALHPAETGQTLFDGIYELSAGQLLSVRSQYFGVQYFWFPNFSKKIRYKSDLEYAEHFKEILAQSVQARLRSTTPVAIQMSGGLDSASIACLAVNMFAPEKLYTISYVFDELSRCDERIYIQEVVKKWNLLSVQFLGDNEPPYKDFLSWPKNPSSPETRLYRLLLQKTYQQARNANIRVLLTGNYADHMYDVGIMDWLTDLILDGRFPRAWQDTIFFFRHLGWQKNLQLAYFRRLGTRSIEAIPWVRKRRMREEAPAWLTDHATAAYFSAHHHQAQLYGKYRSLFDTSLSHASAMEGYFASLHQVEIRQPYRDLRLIEFILAIPAYQLYYRGYNKYILRRAMKGLLPDSLRMRYAPTSLADLYVSGHLKYFDFIQQTLFASNTQWQHYVRSDWLSNQLATPVTQIKDGPHALIPFLCVAYEIWFHFFLSQ